MITKAEMEYSNRRKTSGQLPSTSDRNRIASSNFDVQSEVPAFLAIETMKDALLSSERHGGSEILEYRTTFLLDTAKMFTGLGSQQDASMVWESRDFDTSVRSSSACWLRESRQPAMPDPIELSPAELIQQLRDPLASAEQRQDLILEAEVMSFSEHQLSDLLPLLRDFIQQSRFTDDDDLMVIVGSAVRKYVMNLPLDRCEEVAELFDTSSVKSIPCEIELELAKSLVWRFSSESLEVGNIFQQLTERLAEVACTYLLPRLITKKNYAAVALDSALGLLLLRSSLVPAVLTHIEEMNVRWFTELVIQQCADLRETIQEAIAEQPPALEDDARLTFLLQAEKRLGKTLEG